MVEILVKADPSRSSGFFPVEHQKMMAESNRWRVAMRSNVWRPPTDVYETDEGFVVRVEVAGMREGDFTISLQDRFLSVRGLRPDLPERRAYYQMEIQFGEFNTEVELPYPVNAEEIAANYRDGFLRIVLPKARPHSVTIED
jgi:HSP20 family protein